MTATHPLRVLCVDDNADVADSAAMLLSLYGHEAEACYTGRRALRLYKQFCPDVCLIDLNMPIMDGCEVAHHLRELAGSTPLLLIAVTAQGAEEARTMTAGAGFDLHLIKPVCPAELMTVLSGVEANGHSVPC